MSNNVINISDLFNSNSLVTRQAARQLFNYVAVLQEDNITIDFSKIEYASRSFFDEFNAHQSKLKLLSKKIELLNINENLMQIFNLVKETSLSKSSMIYSSMANAMVINI